MASQILLCFTFLASFTASFADPVIQLPNGLILGREAVTLQNRTYHVFEKIPYATPPIGQLRFKPPLPAQNWEGVLNTTSADVICYQDVPSTFKESEDCLFVNVYTPKVPSTTTDDLLPVMLFIHGGGFILGSGIHFVSDRLIDSDVILVTMNYRLGIFGFLSTQDEVIPGNNGLKDQLLALKWTHDNIHLFGGDPEKITIFGQSSGSASVGYLLLNRQSQGLYKGAIMESGSSLMPSAYQRRAKEIAFGTAALLNDTFTKNQDSEALLDFLLTVDAGKLRSASVEYRNAHNGPDRAELLQGLFWAPVIEVDNPSAFITKKMYGLLRAGNFVSVPIVIGIASEENVGMYGGDKENVRKYFANYDEHLSWLVPDDTYVTDEPNRTELGRTIREMYTQGQPFADHLGDAIRFFGDASLTKATIKFAELYSKFAKTYFYQFSYDGELGGVDVHYDGAESVGHGEELSYLFCLSGRKRDTCDISGYPEVDQITAQRLVKLWTDFAKYQNPTPKPSELLQNVVWPTVDSGFLYLDIDKNLEIKSCPKQKTYSKWVAIYESLPYTDFDTY